MAITESQRTALLELIDLAARGRALRHELEHSEAAPRLQELVAEHKQISGEKDAVRATIGAVETRIAEATAAIEKLRSVIAKKTAELNDGTGLTSRDLVNLQTEIAGHEDKVSAHEDAELEAMDEVESAQEALAGIETHLAEVTVAGKDTQAAIKARKAEIMTELDSITASSQERKDLLPAEVVAGFDRNIAQGGPGAAVATGPNCQACGQQISGVRWNQVLAGDANETFDCEECEAVLIRAS